VPTDEKEMPHFHAATFVRREPLDDQEEELAAAGIPMHPAVLEKLENQNQKRYTKIELTFRSEKGKSQPQVMNATYADVTQQLLPCFEKFTKTRNTTTRKQTPPAPASDSVR